MEMTREEHWLAHDRAEHEAEELLRLAELDCRVMTGQEQARFTVLMDRVHELRKIGRERFGWGSPRTCAAIVPTNEPKS